VRRWAVLFENKKETHMDFASRESKIRQYVHIRALLKHLPSGSTQPSLSAKDSGIFTQSLTKQLSRSQAEKWRRYAGSENGRADCASRTELS
jgi:hypothetical protein